MKYTHRDVLADFKKSAWYDSDPNRTYDCTKELWQPVPSLPYHWANPQYPNGYIVWMDDPIWIWDTRIELRTSEGIDGE